MEPAWLEACRRYAASHPEVEPAVVGVLTAFPTPGAPDDSRPISEQLSACEATLDQLGGEIAAHLVGEVDLGQAELFARRFRALIPLLGREPAGRLLGLGLAHRTRGILTGLGPRALRVRAIIDFYYSQAAILRHRRRTGPDTPTAAVLAAQASYREVAAGILHARITGDTDLGPVHLNALRVRDVDLLTLDARGQGSLPELARRHGAIAGVSGGFFLYSEPNIAPPARRGDPVGLLVQGGRLHTPPIFGRSTLIQAAGGQPAIQTLRLTDCRLTIRARTLRIAATNTAHADGPTAFTRAWGETAPARHGIAVAAGEVIACGQALPIPLAGFVLVGATAVRAEPGDAVTITLRAPLQAAMAGGPRLLSQGEPVLDLGAEDFCGSAPPQTFSQDETFDQNLLPRMAVGLHTDGDLVFLAVDGRDAERAPGLTLARTADVLRSLGCIEAMNLDGGSSKRMLVDGVLVDRSTTELHAGSPEPADRPKRPLRTAVLVRPRNA